MLNLLLHYTGYQQLTKVSKKDKNKIKTKLDVFLTENVTTQSFVLKHWKKLAFVLFKKTIQYFVFFFKLIREMALFETQFSQNRVKPYNDIFKEPIVMF